MCLQKGLRCSITFAEPRPRALVGTWIFSAYPTRAGLKPSLVSGNLVVKQDWNVPTSINQTLSVHASRSTHLSHVACPTNSMSKSSGDHSSPTSPIIVHPTSANVIIQISLWFDTQTADITHFWVNYYDSLTWIKAIWGWVPINKPLIIPVRS